MIKNVRPGAWAHDVPDDPGGPIVPLVQVVGSGGEPGSAQDVNVVSPNPLPVELASPGVIPTNRSGTIAVGGTSQALMAANTARRGYWVQNLSSDDLWINELLSVAAASQPSIQIPAGALYEAPANGVPIGPVFIFGATTGQAFSAREW